MSAADNPGEPIAAKGPPVAAPIGFGAVWMVVVFVILNTLSSTDRSMLAVMIEEIKADLMLTDFQMGLVQGIAFILFYASFGVVLGAAADRFPRRRIMWL